MTEVEQPPQNGIDLSANEEDDNSKARPADIEQDMREMERRKRVEAIMGSKLFREELERIVDSARDSGNAEGILQQLSDIVGMPASRVGSVFKASNCMQPINDIRGVESMGYAKGEKILRCKLAATFRLLDLYGWTQGLGAQITARLKVDQEYFLVNPYGLLYHEITASSLNKVDMQGHIVEQGTTNFGVNKSHFVLHSVLHAARPDIRCAIYIGCSPVVAISSLKTGLLPLTKDACVLGEVTTFAYSGCLLDQEERDKLVRNLGPNSKVMLLTNHGALCCGETIEEAFFAACHIVQACETQLKLLPVGLDNLVLIPEESRKTIYEQSRCPPEDLAKKFAAAVAVADSNKAEEEEKKEVVAETTNTKILGQAPKWRVGGAEFEALMRMLDNAGYRTGYIYRHPLIKSDPPKPKNDVELPPAVSSLGYLLEEEELFRQGIWKKGVMGKGGDRSRWLNSPNVYQKVEVLETGTPDPKKITKWVAEGSPTHSTPVRIDDPLQFVPVNTNPKEFKRLQQQIKDNRRADKISAGPQSHILEGVTWDEANRIKDATVSQAGDHVVLMGAASKGIIQRGFQHNATVYKAPYAKNPFDNVTDDELNEYKRTVERKKKSIHGEYTDTDFSESEALSSLQTSGAQQQTKQNTTTTTTTAAVSQSEPEDISEHQVMRIETQQAPVPSQPEVVLSDATLSFINGERSHTATNRKPPTGRDVILTNYSEITQDHPPYNQETIDLTASQSIAITHCPGKSQDDDDAKTQDHPDERYFDTTDDHHQANYFITNLSDTPHYSKTVLFNEMQSDALFQRQQRKVHQHIMTPRPLPPQCNGAKHYIQNSTLNTPSTHYQSGNDNTLDRSLYTSPPSKPIYMCSKYQESRRADFNSLKSQNETSLYYSNTSTIPNQDTLSYYSTSYFNNSQKIGGASSPIYDYAGISSNATEFTAYNNPEIRNPVVKMSAKSSKCSTPQTCEQILESLEKPSHLQAHYVGANCPLDLIWNIPVRRNYSPSITPPELQNTPPRKVRRAVSPLTANIRPGDSNSFRKSRSPYRTLSHFGFNSPQREPQPDHKHVLPVDCKRYIPIRRSVSYEEIFSSPRYIDLCEHCFEQVVRFKPELMQCRIKLRNLREYYAPPPTTPTKHPHSAQTATSAVAVNRTAEDEDLTHCASTEPYSIFTTQLEPLIEVEERDSFEDRLAPVDLSSITNSTFIDKITRMNYSEISNNFINTPHTASSRLGLGDLDEEEDSIVIQKEIADEDITKKFRNLKINEAAEIKATNDDGQRENPFVSITEIWDFDNWLGEDTVDEVQEEMKKKSKKHPDSIVSMDCENPQKPATTTSSETQTDEIAALANRISQPSFFETQRSLMNRDERTRRKLEFQELWEDHVRYCENREQVMAAAGHSDTESAIDETQQDTRPNEMDKKPTTSSEENLNLNEEIFPSLSFIFSHKSSNQQNTVDQSNEILDDDDVKSSSSKLTFNISEPNSSQENLLCLSYGSTNIFDNYEREKPGQNQEHEEGSDLTPTKQCEISPKTDEASQRSPFSRITASREHLQHYIVDQSKEIIDDDDLKSPNSPDAPQSSSLSRITDSREHLLFRTFGAKNIAVNLALGGTDGYTNQRIQQFIDDDDVIDISDDVGENIDDFPGTQSSLGYRRSCEVFQEKEIGNHERTKHEPLRKATLIREPIEIQEVRVMENFKFSARERKEIHETSHHQKQQIEPEPLTRYKSGILDIYEDEKHLNFGESKLPSTAQGENVNVGEREHEMTTTPGDYDQQQMEETVIDSYDGNSNISDNFDDILRSIDCLKVKDKQTTYKIDHIGQNDQNVNMKSRNFSRVTTMQPESELEVGARYTTGNKTKDILYDFPASQGNTKTSKTINSKSFKDCSVEHVLTAPQGKTNENEISKNLSMNENILGECNKENEAVDVQLSSLEREILEKIEFHQLNKTEEIFNKIENTIRNKLTPSKLEMLVKEQWLRLYGGDDTSAVCKSMPTPQTKDALVTITPRGSPDFPPAALGYLRRSRSLTPLNGNSSSSPPSKLNKTTTPPMGPHKIQHHSPERTPSPCSSSKSTSAKRRNFILENIRNAAIPRNAPQIKRLQGYTQAIFGKNPFGPRPSTCTNSVNVAKKPLTKATLKSPNNKNLAKSHSSPGCSTNVYTFQSKLVRGSPRFWVSLSQSPARKAQTTPTTSSAKYNKEGQEKTPDNSRHVHTARCDLRDTNSSCTTIDTGMPEGTVPSSSCVDVSSTASAVLRPPVIGKQSDEAFSATSGDVSRVDAEINALGHEIQQIQPRLENYKRKLDDFGDRVAKCARNMDECVATHDEIISDHCGLKERMVLQQYVDDVTCRVQTFSLSETED